MTRNEWHIKDVDQATKRIYKVYAVTHNMTIGQVIARAATLLESAHPQVDESIRGGVPPRATQSDTDK